jgi:DNA-binding NtrC family response regulator
VRALSIVCRSAGYDVEAASTAEEAMAWLNSSRFDAILLDLNLSPGQCSGDEGLALVSRIRSADAHARIVVITAHSGVRVAVAAMQAGACDFVMKPWRNADLLTRLEAVIARPSPAGSAPDEPAAPNSLRRQIIGESRAIVQLRDTVSRAARTGMNVLISGAEGTGRRHTALAVHAASDHAEQLPTTIDLLELAAWTMLANAAGPLILLNVDRLEPAIQQRLLTRLPVSCRIFSVVSSTASLIAPLRTQMAGSEIAVPSLAEREEDALLLARHFAEDFARRMGKPQPQFSAGAEVLLRRYRWPGEVRGLELAVERVMLVSDGATIDAAAIVPKQAQAGQAETTACFDLAEIERSLIAAALSEFRHNITNAASALGITRGALYRRMERYGL